MNKVTQGLQPTTEARARLANWRQAPFNQWAFHHVRELLPTADIANDPDNVWSLPEKPLDLSGLPVGDLTLDAFLTRSNADGFVVIHRGEIVYERYANGMTLNTPHILMSVSKSMLGLLAGVLASKGILDLDQDISDLIPELAPTAYAGATVHQVIDMRTGVVFAEDYMATSGPIITYRKATGWNELEPGETASDLHSFYAELTERDRPHGGRFHYISPNTDLAGWAIERAAGRPFAELMSEYIWQPLGARRSAYITVDRLGAPRAAGGMCTTTRDLALVGQLLLQKGARDGREIVPASWIDSLMTEGDNEAWLAGVLAPYFPSRDMHYRAKWYIERGATPSMAALGIHGQSLLVDPKRELVIAKHSSQALPMDEELIKLTNIAKAALRSHFDKA